MNNRNALYFIIGILLIFDVILPLLMIKVDLYFIGLSIDRYRFLASVCDVLVVLYLYHFIRNIKGQTLSKGVIAAWVLMIVLALGIYIASHNGLLEHPEGISHFEAQLREVLLISIPGLIVIGCKIFISIQLRKSQAEGEINNAIRLVGTALLITTITLFLSSFLFAMIRSDGVYMAMHYLTQLIARLPFIAMIYMYWLELKRLNNETANQ